MSSAMSIANLLNPIPPTIPDPKEERVNQLFQKGTISKELFNDKASFDFLSSNTLQEFLKTYPSYKIYNRQELEACIGVQIVRCSMTHPAFEEWAAATDSWTQITCKFIKQVFLNHSEAFLNESITKQSQIINRSISILQRKDASFNAQILGPYLSELSKINLQEVANFLCSENVGGFEYYQVLKYIDRSLKSLH
jgi:hypothetical protein